MTILESDVVDKTKTRADEIREALGGPGEFSIRNLHYIHRGGSLCDYIGLIEPATGKITIDYNSEPERVLAGDRLRTLCEEKGWEYREVMATLENTDKIRQAGQALIEVAGRLGK